MRAICLAATSAVLLLMFGLAACGGHEASSSTVKGPDTAKNATLSISGFTTVDRCGSTVFVLDTQNTTGTPNCNLTGGSTSTAGTLGAIVGSGNRFTVTYTGPVTGTNALQPVLGCQVGGSTPVTLTLNLPAVSLVFTSLKEGDAVKGTANVTVTGAGLIATKLQLQVDGNPGPSAGVQIDQNRPTWDGLVVWNTTGVSGRHSIQVVASGGSGCGVSVTTSPINVNVN